MHQSTAIDFKAMARGVRAGGIVIGMEAARLAESGENDRAEELNKAASSLGELANQLEAWRQEQEQERPGGMREDPALSASEDLGEEP